MLRCLNTKFVLSRWLGLAFLLFIAFLLSGYVYGQGSTALLLQQSPVEAGKLNLSTGVHNFEPNTEITLTAIPKPGYQFVHWLGDVTNPTLNSTTVYLDTPKIVIAVFERLEFDLLTLSDMPEIGSGGGGLHGSAADYARTEGGGGGGKRPHKWRASSPSEEEPEPTNELPASDEGPEANEFPVPEVPEPATAFLLAFGTLLLRRFRGRK